MSRGDDLYLLIRSLSPAEKRTFTIHARRHMDEPHYLSLFETLGRMDVYDESVVRHTFEGTSAERHLPVIRHQLLAELITCLHRLPAEQGPTSELHHEVRAISFLASRGCVQTAERRLRKALAAAQRLELPMVMLDLCREQRRLAGGNHRLVRAIVVEETAAMAEAQELHALQQALDTSTAALATLRLHGTNEVPAVPDGPYRTRVARVRALRLRAQAALATGDTAVAMANYRAALEVVAGAPYLADAHSMDTVDLLLETAAEGALAMDRPLVHEALACTESALGADLGAPVRKTMDVVYAVIALAARMLDPAADDDGTTVAGTLAIEDDVVRLLPQQALPFWYCLRASVDLLDGRGREGLAVINVALNDNDGRLLNPRWFAQVHILNVLAHAQLDNTDYIAVCIRSAIRKAERKTLFTAADLRLLRLLSRHLDPASVRPAAGRAALRSDCAHLPTPIQAIVLAWIDMMSGDRPEKRDRARAA